MNKNFTLLYYIKNHNNNINMAVSKEQLKALTPMLDKNCEIKKSYVSKRNPSILYIME